MEQTEATGYAVDHIVKMMNARFNDPERYKDRPLFDPHWVDAPNELPLPDLEREVDNMFFNTEFAKFTGMSYLEVRQLDLPTFRRLSERIAKYSREKLKHLESLRRDTDYQDLRRK